MSTVDGVPFERLCAIAGIPRPVPEFRFALHLGRQWRFDHAWPAYRLALEFEGGTFAKIPGRHARGAGYRNDLEKYNAAVLLGWRVLRCLPEQRSTIALDLLRRVFNVPAP